MDFLIANFIAFMYLGGVSIVFIGAVVLLIVKVRERIKEKNNEDLNKYKKY